MRLLAPFILLCGACTTIDTDTREQALTPSDVVATIQRVDGQAVRVRGYLRFGSHARHLWDTRNAADQAQFESCVTLIDTDRFADSLRRLSENSVVITGVALPDVMTGFVDYGACNQIGIRVTGVARLINHGNASGPGDRARDFQARRTMEMRRER